MKEIVQQILKTEQEVRDKIEEARKESQKIVRDAETRSREIVEEGRQKAVHEAQELVERLKREAEEERTRQIEAVRGGSPELIESRSREIDRAVERITRLLTGVQEP